MEILIRIFSVFNTVLTAISAIYVYRSVFVAVGLFFTRKFPKASENHKYAVLVAARNEEKVLKGLIDSIKEQDYPQDLITVFVVADNCIDKTAEVAVENGAVCYKRFDENHRTKGFALQYLVSQIDKDYGVDSFEGYFIFDADNVLKSDFITRMNESFDVGEKIITSYRNTKNFGDNWISASYGIHWLRTSRTEHRGRSFLRLATRIQGTGFLFASELIKDGWNYTSLTEDRAFCADAVAKGYTISYNHDAEFYDEQPVSLSVAWVQRKRWARGHLEAFIETGHKLFMHIFLTHNIPYKRHDENGKLLPFHKRLAYNFRLRFMSFDMLSVVFPLSLIVTLQRILTVALVLASSYELSKTIVTGTADNVISFLGIGAYLSANGINQHIITAFILFSIWLLSLVISDIITAVYIFVMERKRIEKLPLYKKIWFSVTFPIFDIIGRIVMVIALFKKADWIPTPHNINKSPSSD